LGSAGGPHLRARALTGAGTLANRTGDYAESERLHRASAPLYREAGDERGYAFALNCVAVQLWRQGQIDGARAYCEESLAQSRTLGDQWSRSAALVNLGGLAMESGDSERAQVHYDEALIYAREAGDARLALMIRLNLVEVYGYRGDYQRAGELAREILPAVADLGDRSMIAACVAFLADGAAAAGAPERATRLLGGAAHLLEAVGEQRGPHDRARDAERVGSLRRELGEAAFAVAWAVGQALTLEQLVAYAGVDSLLGAPSVQVPNPGLGETNSRDDGG
jgi:tetratricopeptide (TPR) repeat protein